MNEPTLLEQWSSAEWRAEVAAWVDEQLASARMIRSGELEPVRIRP